jgi:cytochrome P450
MRDAATFTVDDPRFSTARVIGPSMLSLDGMPHTRHREPFARSFRPADVRARFTAFVAAETGRLIAAAAPAGAAEVRQTIAGPLSVAVVAEALGLENVDAAAIRAWYHSFVAAISDITAGQEVSGTAAATAFGKLRSSVEQTLRHGDGSSLLVAAAAGGGEQPAGGADGGHQAGGAGRGHQAGGAGGGHRAGGGQQADGPGGAQQAAGSASGLTTLEVVSNAAVLMFGGIDTTEGMITNAVAHLLGHPAQLDLVRADPSLLPNAIEESVRLEPAAAVIDRYATTDVTLAGAPIRRGELVRVSIAGANRDPEVFGDPDRFDVRRENTRLHLAFALGPHFCFGAHLARLQTQTAVRGLLDQLPGLRLDPAKPSAPSGLVFRKPAELHVRWD